MDFGVSRRFVVRGVLGIFTLVICVLLLVRTEQKRTESELAVIVSAYLSDGILHDAHDWGSGRVILVALQSEAQQPGVWRSRWLYPFDSRFRFPESSVVTRSSFTLSNALPGRLLMALHLPAGVTTTVVSRAELKRADASGEFQTRFPTNLGDVAVSRAGLNLDKTEASFYLDHSCGLCGAANMS